MLYGLAGAGGANNRGVIYSVDPVTDTYQDIFDFNNTSGSWPSGSLIQLSNGYLYGMTYAGGANNVGTIFSFDPANNNFTNLKDLNPATGKNPIFGGLIQASNTKLYGMTYGGGMNNKGVIFSFDLLANSYTDLFDFNGINGEAPGGSLIQASNGRLYGMTPGGGTYSFGVIFSYDISTNIYTKLFDFNSSTGSNPLRSLVQGTNGKLYGTANSGGAYNVGVVFSYNITSNTYTDLYDFDGINGAAPDCDIVEIFPTSTTGLETMVKNNGINIFPNPFIDKLNIIVNNSDLSEIILYDITSRKILQQNFTNSFSLNTEQLSKGIYIYEVRNKNGIIKNGKVVKE